MPPHVYGDVPGIQYLRGVAALSVVLFHITFQINSVDHAFPLWESLQSGVDLFFVISGFVMVYSTRGGTATSAREFLTRRTLRIVPLYWSATLAMCIVLVAAPSLVKSSKLEPVHAIASFLFLPAHNPVGSTVIPLVAVGWTLNLEMFFYLVFATAIALGSGRKGTVILLAAAPLAALSILGFASPAPGLFGFYTNPVLLEFIYGMGIAWLFSQRRWTLHPAWAASLPLLFLAMILPLEAKTGFRCFRYGLPAAAMVACASFAPLPRSRWLHRLGDISFSLYVSHFFTLSAATQAWRRAHLSLQTDGSRLAFIASATVASLVVGHGCWLLVEQPFARWARRLRGRRDAREIILKS